MEVKKEMVPPCGLYCGVCSIRMAHRDDNLKFKERLATLYNLTPEEIRCEGCNAEEEKVFFYCRVCPIKSCAKERGYEGCHQCDDWPCEHVENFVMPVGKRVMLRAIPQWRELGTERWVEEEEKRYRCPGCGQALFRGAKRCNACGEAVDVD